MKKPHYRLKITHWVAMLIFMCCAFSTTSLLAQAGPTVIRGWKSLGEATNRIDVSYRIVKCDIGTPAQIHLNVFNENTTVQTLTMVLVVSNGNGQTTNVNVSVEIPAAAILKADCGNANYSSLKIAVPSGYDPNTINVSANYDN